MILPPQQLNQQPKVGDAYLKLLLNRQTAAVLPMKSVQKVLVVPVESITPIANVPAPVLGWLNQRSRVFWVVDLPHLLGVSVLENLKSHSIAIVKAEFLLGLAVQEVKGVVRLEPDAIQPPTGKVKASLLPYLQGCTLQQKKVIPILNLEAVFHSPVLHSF